MADDLIIDLSNYKDRVGQRVIPGTYRVQVEDVETGKSGAGNPMITLFLRVMGGEFDGATLVDRLTLTDNAMFRVVNFMQAIGLPTPRKRLKVNPQRFKGKVLDVEVDDGDPYRGTIKSEVRTYMKVAGGAKAEEKDLDDLDSDNGQEALDLDGTKASAPSAEDSGTSDDVADLDEVDLDDIEV